MKRQTQEWQEPSDEQIALETRMSHLILTFITSSIIKGSEPYLLFSSRDQDNLVMAITVILQKAHDLGTHHGLFMLLRQERAFRNVQEGSPIRFLDRAKEIVTGFVGRIRDLIVSALSSDDRDASLSDDQVVQGVIDRVSTYLPDAVGGSEVHDGIEQAVMDTFAENDIDYVVWIASPGACELCTANAAQGKVKRGEDFQSGHTEPGAHTGCRCNVVPAHQGD